jgi:Second Messenger Oligonucleotide or Dinucleotide Synthetase domain
VTSWLAADESALSEYEPLLYPQGSLLLDTTVRPIRQAEFDLDVVCVLNMVRGRSPAQLYDLIRDRMYEHKMYRDIMEPKDRCIRLNYAQASQFHLDIVPAIVDDTKGGHHILIADKFGDQMVWKTSNPKGFLHWFVSRKVFTEQKVARFAIEPLHRPLSADNKAVLTKCVQILKRWRDVKWKDEPLLATPSIVLTCLAAACYQGEDSVVEAMTGILAAIEAFVLTGEREIFSPANQAYPPELISEKWLSRAACYEAFARAVPEFREDWSNLVFHKRGPQLYAALNELFGDQAARAIKDVSNAVGAARANGDLYAARDTGRLAVSGAMATSAVARVKPNTFYGN